MLQRQNINNQIKSRFTPATDLKIGTFVLIPNFNTQKGISKKLQALRKGPYQIIAKPTDVTYKLADSTKKEIIHLLPYYPKEYALRELTQLYSFTCLKVIQNLTHTEQETNLQDNIHHKKKTKSKTKHNSKQNKNTRPKNTSKRRKKQENDRKNSTTRTSREIRT